MGFNKVFFRNITERDIFKRIFETIKAYSMLRVSHYKFEGAYFYWEKQMLFICDLKETFFMKNDIFISVIFGVALSIFITTSFSGCTMPTCMELSGKCIGSCHEYVGTGRCDYSNTKQPCEGGTSERPCRCKERKISENPNTKQYECYCPTDIL